MQGPPLLLTLATAAALASAAAAAAAAASSMMGSTLREAASRSSGLRNSGITKANHRAKVKKGEGTGLHSCSGNAAWQGTGLLPVRWAAQQGQRKGCRDELGLDSARDKPSLRSCPFLKKFN